LEKWAVKAASKSKARRIDKTKTQVENRRTENSLILGGNGRCTCYYSKPALIEIHREENGVTRVLAPPHEYSCAQKSLVAPSGKTKMNCPAS